MKNLLLFKFNIPQMVAIRQHQYEVENSGNNVRINWEHYARVIEAKQRLLNQE